MNETTTLAAEAEALSRDVNQLPSARELLAKCAAALREESAARERAIHENVLLKEGGSPSRQDYAAAVKNRDGLLRKALSLEQEVATFQKRLEYLESRLTHEQQVELHNTGKYYDMKDERDDLEQQVATLLAGLKAAVRFLSLRIKYALFGSELPEWEAEDVPVESRIAAISKALAIINPEPKDAVEPTMSHGAADSGARRE